MLISQNEFFLHMPYFCVHGHILCRLFAMESKCNVNVMFFLSVPVAVSGLVLTPTFV